jgi:hypothetical protein
MSTTSHLVNPENASRFFVVNADESREQTGRIHEAQRRKYSVSRFQEKDEEIPRIVKTHQAAQRLLEKKRIVNPFASLLSFPTSLMRTSGTMNGFLIHRLGVFSCVSSRKARKRKTASGSSNATLRTTG